MHTWTILKLCHWLTLLKCLGYIPMQPEIGYFTRAAKDMWSQLIELQPQSGETGAGISREEFIGNIASDIQVSKHCYSYIHSYICVCT